MTENPNDKPNVGETVQPQGGITGPAQGASVTTDPDLLQKIADLEKDNKKYRDERKAQDAAAKKFADEQLISQQKWEELAKGYKTRVDELEPIAEKNGTIEAAFNALLDSQLKDIPEDVRKKLVEPARKGMSPVEFSDWLSANKNFLSVKPAPPLDGGAGQGTRTTGAAVTLTADQMEMARISGMSYEEYAGYLARSKSQGEIPWTKTPKE